MCQVQAGACVSLLTPGETKYSDCHPRKTTTYILNVVSITTHTHDRRRSIGEKETKKRKEDKGKLTKRKTKKASKEKKKTRKVRNNKTRKQGKEKKRKKEKRKRKRKRKKNVILADPRNWLRMALDKQRVSRPSSMAPGRERNMAKKSGRSYAILPLEGPQLSIR